MSLIECLREGARTALFMRPRLNALPTRPSTVLALLVLLVLCGIAVQRWALAGPAQFDPAALTGGWLATLLAVGVCAIVAGSLAATTPVATEPARPLPASTATLFAVLIAQELVLSLPLSLLYLAALQGELQALPFDTDALVEGVWMASLLWIATAAALMLWRHASQRVPTPPPVGAAIVAFALLTMALPVLAPSPYYWVTEAPPASDETGDAAAAAAADGYAPDEPPAFALTQAVIEAQSRALPAALDALATGRPGIVDLYAITFAPYADEDVFSREVGMVSEVMRTRFDAHQRVVQLQNHARTAGEVPWATGLNLQRSIGRIAQVMNRDEDILFIHLTSHGAQDGQLAASFKPLTIDAVTPAQLAAWLAAAGVRYRVISISACYSGAWIAPLSAPGALVMTAADAHHTSYGCGRKSELTFFGRAMYDEQLRTATRSFEAAHAAVRPVIEQREKAAGKTDGYSNPQIAVGSAIRAPLRRLQQRLEALSIP